MATPAMNAIAKKTKPVTSSQSRCITRPTWWPVIRMPFMAALRVRFRPAELAATRAKMLSLRAVDSCAIVVDFIKTSGYNYASTGLPAMKHMGLLRHLKYQEGLHKRGNCGPATQTINERAR